MRKGKGHTAVSTIKVSSVTLGTRNQLSAYAKEKEQIICEVTAQLISAFVFATR